MRSVHPHAPSLRQVQEWMAARILGPAAGDLDDAGLEEWLYVPSPARAAERLNVYAGGFPARVHDALLESYPAVAHSVGEPAFVELAQRYAAAVPLQSYNLNDAGAQMPVFLRDDRLTADLPYLPDLASLEWRVARAFHARDGAPLEPQTLGWSVEDWAGAVLHFQPSVAAVSSAWPILDLWAARETPRDEIDVDLRNRPDRIIVRRAGLTVRCESVAAEELETLESLLAGQPLAEAADRLERDGHDPSAVLAWFSRWMAAGMIAGATRGSERQ